MKQLLTLSFVLLFLLSPLSLADSVLSDLEQQQEQLEKLQDTKDSTLSAIEEARTNFLGEQWKAFFLANKYIAGVNGFFESISIVFVIFFAHPYSFSLEFFFVFLLWVLTILSIPAYFVFTNSSELRFVSALGVTIVIAHLQIFNLLAKTGVQMLFYRKSTLWSIITFVILMGGLVLYYFVNKIFAARIKKLRDRNKSRGIEYRVKKIEKFNAGVERGSSA